MRQLPLPLPPKLALVFFPQRRPAGPIITAYKQQQERNRQKIERFDREDNHPQEIRSYRELRIWEPSASAPVLHVFQAHTLLADRVFGSSHEPGLISDQRLDH